MPGPEQMPNMTAAAPPANQAESGADAAERSSVEAVEANESQKEITPEESLAETQKDIKANEEESAKLEGKNEKADERFEELRDKFGIEESKRSDAAKETDRTNELNRQKEYLEKQEMRYVAIIAERRARTERMLKKEVAELFKEFDGLEEPDLDNLEAAGVMLDGKPFDSKTFGELNPETAMFMVQAYRGGMEKIDIQDFTKQIEVINVAIYREVQNEAVGQPAEGAQAEDAVTASADMAQTQAPANETMPTRPISAPSAPSAAPSAPPSAAA